MPHIRETGDGRRDALDPTGGTVRAETAGELTYQLTRLCDAYIGDPTYQRIAETYGALMVTALELWRQIGAPYEAAKAADNGNAIRPRDP